MSFCQENEKKSHRECVIVALSKMVAIGCMWLFKTVLINMK